MSDPRHGFPEFRATYRLQFHKGFTFRHAERLVPYLAELGISHLYASPLMEARPGSTHGYDIVNHNRFNPEIGTEAEFRAMVAALHRHGMGLIVDFVPNHMGVGAYNAWWLDVLEWGEESPYAEYFDINWEPARPDLKGRVLLPVLGDQYGVILEKGEIALRFDRDEGSLSAWYYDHRFPISPHSYPVVLRRAGPPLDRLARAFAQLRAMPARAAWSRARELKRALAEAEVGPALETAVAAFNGRAGRPASFRRLHRLLEAQAYRLADWHVAAEEINYRRFFNINDLAGLRIELPELFAETHRLAFALIDRGELNGLRIDHIDGLFDPAEYCSALQRGAEPPLFVVVEKILARYERLPDWPVAGTTGYDFAGQVLPLFVDSAAEESMTRLYARITGRRESFDEVLYGAKKRIMRVNLASEMNVLAMRFHRLAMADWRTRDFTLRAMLNALEEVIAAFPVYRTYVSGAGCGPDDRRYIDWAIAQAKQHWGRESTTVFDFIQGVLTADLPGRAGSPDVLRVAMQFQQVTGPVMAKSFEDTAFYRYARLIALNEVGGDPRRFGLSSAAFHHIMAERCRSWPRALLTTATHDTKRGEDARLRIALLSEMPGEWRRRVLHWMRINRRHRSEIGEQPAPSRNAEYIFYQAMVGAWPPGLAPRDQEGLAGLAERLDAYMVKAVREGKEDSGWSYPNEPYEAALQRFVRGALDAGRPNPFLVDFAEFVGRLARPAAVASLAQLVLKLTAPGIPDIYQGGELWDFSLVDPDNRRPVDFAVRRELSRDIERTTPGDLAGLWQDGREKLFVIRRLLALRRTYPELFAEGDYQPVDIGDGSNAERICSFVRRHGERVLVVAVPRLTWGLYKDGGPADFGETSLALPAATDWRDVLADRSIDPGERVRASDLFAEFPAALWLGAARE